VTATPGDQSGDLGKTGHGGDHANAGHSAAHIWAVDDHLDSGTGLGKPILFPERGPRRDDQDESRFEKVRGEQQPADDPDDQLPVCTFDRRSTRAPTSR
jgi:hypothetical protein